MVADYIKNHGVVDNEEDCQRLWHGIDQLQIWSQKRQMGLNLGMSDVML